MKHLLNLTLIATINIYATYPALAHDPTPHANNNSTVRGMNYIKITKDPTKKETVKDEIKEEIIIEPSEEEQAQIKEALEKPLMEKKKKQEELKKSEEKERDYFTKQDELQEWAYLRSILSTSQEEQSLAIKELEKGPENASPMILLLASDFYFKQGNKEQAAIYFLASKLRAEFDIKRWTIINESGIRSRKKHHPAKEVIELSQSLSSELSSWILSNKQRAQTILKKLETWEKDTSYSYLPTYEINSEEFDFTEYEELKEMHDKHLKDFIKTQNDTLSLIHP